MDRAPVDTHSTLADGCDPFHFFALGLRTANKGLNARSDV
jgi:hypothetical protein